jgi:hypothetical protein
MTEDEVALLEKKWSSCKYKPEYADRLLDHLSKGLSFTSFNVEGGVSYSTLVNWCRRFPEFAQAREIGEKARLQLLEEEGIKMIKAGNVVAWKFMMNQLGMSEKVTVESAPAIPGNPHTSVPPSIRYGRLQRLKELHQKVSQSQTIEVEAQEIDGDLGLLEED